MVSFLSEISPFVRDCVKSHGDVDDDDFEAPFGKKTLHELSADFQMRMLRIVPYKMVFLRKRKPDHFGWAHIRARIFPRPLHSKWITDH